MTRSGDIKIFSDVSRSIACTAYLFEVPAQDELTGKQIGAFEFVIWEYWITDPASLTITHGLRMRYNDDVGVVTPELASVTLSIPCAQALSGCTAQLAYQATPVYWLPGSTFDRVTLETFAPAASEDSAPTSPSIESDTIMTVQPLPSPGYDHAKPNSFSFEPYEAVRCDRSTPADDEDPDPSATPILAGCVNPRSRPTIVFDVARNPVVRPVAIHMAGAQVDLPGHPGSPLSPNPLSRVTSKAQISANRAAACSASRFTPEPPLAKSCDEYPFASTAQGAAAASVAAVPLSANQSQGGILTQGYRKWHINDGDEYYVSIINIGPTPINKIMVVGDSISQGNEGDYTWRYRLYRHLVANSESFSFVGPRTGTHLMYAGGSSNGTYRISSFDTNHDALWGRALIDEKETIRSETASYQPDIILAQIGINDLLWGRSSVAGLRDSMQKFITEARAAQPGVKFVLGTLMNRTPLSQVPNIARDVSDYNSQLRTLAAGMSTLNSPIVIADPSSGYNPNVHSYDGLHPNELGEYVIAKAYADALYSGLGIGSAYGSIPTSVAKLALSTPELRLTVNAGGILASWYHVFGATGYYIWIKGPVDANLNRLPLPIGDDHWQIEGLVKGDKVSVAVQAIRGDSNQSARSATLSAVANPSTPPAVSVVYSSPCAGCTTTTLSWPAASTATSYDVNYYDPLTMDILAIKKVSATTTSIPTVAGHTVNIAVQARNASGAGPATGAPATIGGYGTPNAPTLQTVTILDSTTVKLIWTAVPHAAGYWIWTRQWDNGSSWTRQAYEVSTTSVQVGWLYPGSTKWEFRISAANGSLTSGYSNVKRGT